MSGQPNAELAYRVLDHIDAHPEQHDQGTWIRFDTDCGTVACFAGWTCLLAGDTPATPVITLHNEVSRVTVVEDGNDDHAHDRSVKYRAAELLGLYSGEWRQLFYVGNRAALGRVVAEIFGPRPDDTGGCPPGGCIPNFCVGADDCRREYDSNGDVIYDEDDLPPNAGSAS